MRIRINQQMNQWFSINHSRISQPVGNDRMGTLFSVRLGQGNLLQDMKEVVSVYSFSLSHLWMFNDAQNVIRSPYLRTAIHESVFDLMGWE